MIGAFLTLLNRGTILVLEKTFVTMLRQAIHNKNIATQEEFLKFFFGQSLHNTMCQLKICQSVLISVFNTKITGTKNGRKECSGDHCGLAVLDKYSATLRLYDSSHPILSHLLQLNYSIRSKYELTQAEWLVQWTYFREVYSVQQGKFVTVVFS